MFVVIGNKPIMNANIIERISNNKLVCDQLFETILDPLTNINKKNHLIFQYNKKYDRDDSPRT